MGNDMTWYWKLFPDHIQGDRDCLLYWYGIGSDPKDEKCTCRKVEHGDRDEDS